MTAELRRIVMVRRDYGDQGTFGRLQIPGLEFFTGELPWRDNAPNVSCLPTGVYKAVWNFSPRFKRFLYLLLGTSPRAGIRAHPANLMGDKARGFYSQLNGCIAFGERLGWMEGQKALLLSAPAVRRFETYMDRKPFELEIR